MTTEFLSLPSYATNPSIAEHFGLWCCQESVMHAAASRFEGMDLATHLRLNSAHSRDREPSSFQRQGRTAIVSVTGVMMKRVSSLSSGTSTIEARRAIREAVADDDISSLLIAIESPGGTSSGTQDLAAEIAAANAKKPTWAFIEDLGASAAYWIASQAGRVVAANNSTLVGSIGTYCVFHDESERANKLGIRVHVVRAGEHKGDGIPGTEITDAQLAEFQRVVDSVNEQFLSDVSNGRSISREKLASIADGRVHVAVEAMELGLVDAVQSLESTLAELQSQSVSKPFKAPKMTATAPTPATLSELRAACPGATDTFLLEQLDANATVETATKNFLLYQTGEIKRLKAAQEIAASADTLKTPDRGAEPLKTRGAASSGESHDSDEEFHSLVRDRMASGATRRNAVMSIARRYPALHRAYLERHNTRKGARSLIEERFAK